MSMRERKYACIYVRTLSPSLSWPALSFSQSAHRPCSQSRSLRAVTSERKSLVAGFSVGFCAYACPSISMIISSLFSKSIPTLCSPY